MISSRSNLQWGFRLASLVFALFFSCNLMAQLPEAFALFESDSIIEARLTTDIKQLVKQKMKEEYQPAVFEIFMPDGDTLRYEIEIKSRGNIRKEVCYYPPIMLKFPKDKFANHKLKWVGACRDSDYYDQVLLREYSAYKMFEQLTDKSFKTHLMRVEHVDTGRDEKSFVRYAFVLENKEALAERLGGRVYEPRLLKESVLNEQQMALFTYFQFMIANTDWHFKNMHNMELIAERKTSSVLAIPYDFDYSGYVNSGYAVVSPDVPITDVRTRHNKGFCLTEEVAEATRQFYLEHQDEMMGALQGITYFSQGARKENTGYMEEFWTMMTSEKRCRQVFAKNCQTLE